MKCYDNIKYRNDYLKYQDKNSSFTQRVLPVIGEGPNTEIQVDFFFKLELILSKPEALDIYPNTV